MTVSSHLNLYAEDSPSVKAFDLSVTEAQSTLAGSKIHFANVVSIANTTADIPDVGAKIHLIDAAIASWNAGSAAASQLVQQNLDAYETSNNAALASLSATVTQNKAISDSEHIFDATARTNLETSLSADIVTEATARANADAGLAADIAAETAARAAAVTGVADDLSSYETSNDDALNVERLRIDAILSGASVDLNTFVEVVSAYENADTSILATIGNIQNSIAAIQAQLASLTDP